MISTQGLNHELFYACRFFIKRVRQLEQMLTNSCVKKQAFMCPTYQLRVLFADIRVHKFRPPPNIWGIICVFVETFECPTAQRIGRYFVMLHDAQHVIQRTLSSKKRSRGHHQYIIKIHIFLSVLQVFHDSFQQRPMKSSLVDRGRITQFDILCVLQSFLHVIIHIQHY